MFFMTLRMAFSAVFSNKMRSFLTILGITIGVVSVVMLVSIGQAASGSITSSISEMGSNLITANITDSDVSVSQKDIEGLSDYASINAVAPVISSSATVRSGSTAYSTTVLGVTPDYAVVQDLLVQSGRNILQSDVDWRTRVCVVGTDVADEVFESYDIIGETLTFNNQVYTIVGLLESSGTSTFGSADDRVLIPYTTAQRATGDTSVTTFYASAADSDSVTQAEAIIEMTLLELTRDEDAYTVYDQSQVLDTMSDVTDTMSMLLAGIGAISLLVGGIGIMNIMLVSVTERTREIGIRKAIGARKRNILSQFLIEACVLSLLGGLLGLGISILGIQVYNYFTDSVAVLSGTVALGTVLFCAVIGVVFGSYPAARAAKLIPMDALRYTG